MEKRSFSIAAETEGRLRTVRDAGKRILPERYRTDLWDLRFRERLDSALRPGMSILDIGAGRRPTLAPPDRPEGTTYVGLDPDADELRTAPEGSYDEAVVSAAEHRVPELEGRFDLALSFFAFEHVESTAETLESIRGYLRPGGMLLAQLAGARSPFSVANRLLPAAASRALLRRAMGRPADSVFPAAYDHCTHGELAELLEPWAEAEVMPLYTAAGYVLFSRVLTAAYIGYEEWLYRGDRRELAPYYLVAARR